MSILAVTRDSYIIRDAMDPQSQAAMQALETRLCNYNATKVAGREDQLLAERLKQSGST